jgi:CHASE3 domain sensor protein
MPEHERGFIATKMHAPLSKSALIGFGLVAALLIGNAALGYRNTQRLQRDLTWVAHTHEVLDLTGGVLLALVDAETGQRGYLVTGKDEFLQPYSTALENLNAQIAVLGEKTRDNPQQQNRIESLIRRIDPML